MIDYFFSGNKYIRVTRGDAGAGALDPGYPAPISGWNWGAFGTNGIDAALYSGSKCYFFSGNQYIRVTKGVTGRGTMDPGYPAPISNWGWGAFGANGIDAALWSGSVCYFFSGNQYIRVTRGDTGAGSMDAGYPQPISNWNWGAFGANGIKGALYSGGPLVAPPPTTGLVSNHNYFLEENGNSLLGLSVTINIDVDFISAANAWSMQLNGYSALGDSTGVQQYVVYVSPNSTQLVVRIDNWDSSLAEIIRTDVNLANLPGTTLPAGYAITIALNNDASGNVTGATFTVTDNKGNSLGAVTTNIVGQTLRTTAKPATSANLAPIRTFQLNIGGDYGGARATLTSGAGTITYTASNPLSVVNTAPSYIDDQNAATVESANLIFGPMPASANNAVTQSFQAVTTGATVGQIDLGKVGRSLPPPGRGVRQALPPP